MATTRRLKITRARLQQYERRIYFDCDAGTALALYYGDEKLNAPVYDYAKLFQVDANAGQLRWATKRQTPASLGAPTIGLGRNAIPRFCGRRFSRR